MRVDWLSAIIAITLCFNAGYKVARPSIFIGTPSTFESLILKQIYLYCKAIKTYGLHLD